MKRALILSGGFALFTSLAGGAARADTAIKLEDMPKAVQATVKAQSKGATIHGLSQSDEDGKTSYELELVMTDGHRKDLDITADGSVDEIEEETTLSAVPSVPQKAIQATAGKATIERVEAVSKGDGVVFCWEVGISDGSKHSEFRVGTDGKPAADDDD